MACGCGAPTPGEQWEVVNADGTVGKPTTKQEATMAAKGRDGAWIRQVQTASV
jgi:hypothetical protein